MAPWKFITPVLVYLVLLPGAIRIFTADLVVGGINGGTPETVNTAELILKDFPASGGGVPLVVVLDAQPGTSIKNEAYFAAACKLSTKVLSYIEPLGVTASDLRGPWLDGSGSCIDFQTAQQDLSSSAIYRYFWQKSASANNHSALLSVALPFDAFSDEAKDLVSLSRQAVDSYLQTDRYRGTVAAFHPMAAEVDAEQLVANRFPWVVAATLVVVFSVIALRYRAALIPFKLFFTIGLPIISVLGTGVFVFQDGFLNWTRIPSMKSEGGLVWINPVACTFMLIGFALDYDIFLFSRIYADRKDGVFLEDKDAIIHAVAKTGPVITTAGVIMALAFSGMVIQSTNPFLCQMGFTMIFGVLMDTFVVRTLLVPAFLSMAGSYNWWPGKMPSQMRVQ